MLFKSPIVTFSMDFPQLILKGKICLITGSTDGIGKATAMMLAKMGATTIVHGRNEKKAQDVVNEIKRNSGNQEIEYLIADFTSLLAVRRMAKLFKRRYNKLHILVNNAGAAFSMRFVTKDGLEETFEVNHLSHFLLTNLLMPELKKGKARIAVISSYMHSFARLDMSDLQMERGFSGMRQYGNTKLENVLFAYELARRVGKFGICVNVMDPGLVATKFGTDRGGIMGVGKRLINVFGKRPETPARTIVHMVASPDMEGVTGKFYKDMREIRSSHPSYSKESAGSLWEISEKLVHLE